MTVGDNWNGWQVAALIGEGQFGKVFKLERTEFGHKYEAALKVIRIPRNESEYRSIKSEGMDAESITEYYRSVVEDITAECALMYELKGNSNIVSYEGHQVVQLKDSFGWEIYIKMELLTPLISYLEAHPMTEKDAVRLGIDICKALELCQRYSIIHRDIKPENVFVSKQGNFKLGDFGIARRMEEATAGMSKKGTYTYMAPEVFAGKPYNATVDTYSLGIMLYRLVNHNRAPFLPPYPNKITFADKEKAGQMRLSGKAIPAPDSASQEFAEVILKACAFDPKSRYRTPAEMRADLEKLVASRREIKGKEISTVTEKAVTVTEETPLPDRKAPAVIGDVPSEDKTFLLFPSQASKSKDAPVAGVFDIENTADLMAAAGMEIEPVVEQNAAAKKAEPEPVAAEKETVAEKDASEKGGSKDNDSQQDLTSVFMVVMAILIITLMLFAGGI